METTAWPLATETDEAGACHSRKKRRESCPQGTEWSLPPEFRGRMVGEVETIGLVGGGQANGRAANVWRQGTVWFRGISTHECAKSSVASESSRVWGSPREHTPRVQRGGLVVSTGVAIGRDSDVCWECDCGRWGMGAHARLSHRRLNHRGQTVRLGA